MQFLRTLAPMFAQKTQRLIDLLKTQVDQPVTIHELTTLLTLEVICKVW